MEEELRFEIRRAGKVVASLSDDELRELVREGRFDESSRVRLAGTTLWVSASAFATLVGRRYLPDLPKPPAPGEVKEALPPELAATPPGVRDMLRYCVHEGEQVYGPLTGEQIRQGRALGRFGAASLAVVGEPGWYPASRLFDEPEAAPKTARCPTCLETIPAGLAVCAECDEPTGAASAREAPRLPPAQAVAGGDAWLRTHWRPLVAATAIAGLMASGVALRHLAPAARPEAQAATAPARPQAAACSETCWSGESCISGACVWQAPNDVGHVADKPVLAGPFSLPRDVSDALPLDGERFAAALLTGTQILSARTGEVLSLVSEAPFVRKLFRVNDVVYATSPQRIYVVDAASTRLLKTIELGASVGSIAVGASGHRVLASLPHAHAVAILAAEYHAEIDRIHFGDDVVGPVGTDDTGKRALTTTGAVPLPGLRNPSGGAVYAFDPSRLASAQDRVRTSMLGNPVAVLMSPDGASSYVALRADDALVPLEWLPSGAVKQQQSIPTCREPEQIELVRAGRRAVVRCNAGKALEVFDLRTGERTSRIALRGRAVDMAVSPDGEQAVVAVRSEEDGFAALVDLATEEVSMLPLSQPPSRVRLTPDGRTALVLSDSAKVAWVIR